MRVEAELASVDVGRARTAKLTDGAHQFEAMMLGEMLKGLKFGAAVGDAGEEDAGGRAGGTIQQYGTEALAKAISQGGGFGLARQIVQQVTLEDTAKGAGLGAGKGSKV